jgi:hypothetical protein
VRYRQHGRCSPQSPADYPGEKECRTPIVPILTPTTMEWLTEKIFSKDVKFTF